MDYFLVVSIFSLRVSFFFFFLEGRWASIQSRSLIFTFQVLFFSSVLFKVVKLISQYFILLVENLDATGKFFPFGISSLLLLLSSPFEQLAARWTGKKIFQEEEEGLDAQRCGGGGGVCTCLPTS